MCVCVSVSGPFQPGDVYAALRAPLSAHGALCRRGLCPGCIASPGGLHPRGTETHLLLVNLPRPAKTQWQSSVERKKRSSVSTMSYVAYLRNFVFAAVHGSHGSVSLPSDVCPEPWGTGPDHHAARPWKGTAQDRLMYGIRENCRLLDVHLT